MTNYERIVNLDVDEMAYLLTRISREEDVRLLNSVSSQGYDVSLVSVDEKLQTELNRQWLEEEEA